MATLQPLVTRFDPASTPTELPNAAFLADAIEALIQVDRSADAEPLIDALERNGQRLGRPWMMAVGARGRSMLLADRGDLDAATRGRRARDRRTRPGADTVRACSNTVAAGPITAAATQKGVRIGEPAGSLGHLRTGWTSRCGPTVPVPNSSEQTSVRAAASSSRRPSSGSPSLPRRA